MVDPYTTFELDDDTQRELDQYEEVSDDAQSSDFDHSDEEVFEATEAPQEAPVEEEEVDWQARVAELEAERDQAARARDAIIAERQAARQELQYYKQDVQQRLDALQSSYDARYSQEEEQGYVDPVERLENRVKGVQERLDQQAQAQQNQEIQAQQMSYLQGLVAKTQEYEAPFRESNPDYDDAVKHLQKVNRDLYVNQGYSREQAEQWTKMSELNLIHNALQNGQNPAEVAYALAKNAGWTPGTSQGNPGGGSSATTQSVTATARQGTNRPKSLSQAGGSSGATAQKWSIEALMEHDPKEFDRKATDLDAWEEMFNG